MMVVPEHIKKMYVLILKEGYRPRQIGYDLYRGQLNNHYRITLKKKKKPIITIILAPGKGNGNSWYV
jgi:hypothetical protein